MFSINNTEGVRGGVCGGGGRMSDLIWEAVLYTKVPLPLFSSEKWTGIG